MACALVGCARSSSSSRLVCNAGSSSTTSGPTLVATRRQPSTLCAMHTALPSRRNRAAMSAATSADPLATTINGLLRRTMSFSSRSQCLSLCRAGCGRGNNRETSAGHAQHHRGAIRVLAWRKPPNVEGRAVFTVQHGFAFDREIRCPGPTGCIARSPVGDFHSKQKTCHSRRLLRRFCYAMMTKLRALQFGKGLWAIAFERSPVE